MDFDAGITDRADGDGQSDPLEQGKVHVHIEALRLKTGKAVGDVLKLFPHGIEVIQPFAETKVAQIVRAQLVAQEAGELLVLSEQGVLPVRTEAMVAVLELFDDGG